MGCAVQSFVSKDNANDNSMEWKRKPNINLVKHPLIVLYCQDDLSAFASCHASELKSLDPALARDTPYEVWIIVVTFIDIWDDYKLAKNLKIVVSASL